MLEAQSELFSMEYVKGSTVQNANIFHTNVRSTLVCFSFTAFVLESKTIRRNIQTQLLSYVGKK